MTDWTIRAATPDDVAPIVALVRALSVEEGYLAPPLRAEEVRAEGFGRAPRFHVLIAEQEGQAVGYALYFPSYDTDHAARGFYLQDLYVRPELMTAVARACETDGGCYLFWNALERTRAGRAFYRRIGAREEPVVTLSLQPAALRRLAEEASEPMPGGARC